MHRGADRSSIRLPANRAFVVQFAAGATGGQRLSGRAEHLNSGRVTHFASLGELAVFVEEVIGALPRTEPDQEDLA